MEPKRSLTPQPNLSAWRCAELKLKALRSYRFSNLPGRVKTIRANSSIDICQAVKA
jgi:hypothetical protein